MAYSNYRSEWSRGRNERWRTRDRAPDEQYTQRDDDDSRLARESMERDYYGSGERGGYRRHEREDDRGPRYNRGYGQGDHNQSYGRNQGSMGGRYSQGQRFSESGYGRGREYVGGESRHHGNEMGGWEGREEEQWRNRDVHGQYDRDANYGGFSSRRGNPSAYGEGVSYQGGSGRWGQAGSQYSRGEESGPHRGRGPRGYKRSDDRVREQVCDCLTDDDWLDASNIEVTVKDGEVTLSGYVSDREDKRRAESLAERIPGVRDVQNSLRVQRAEAASQSASPGGSGKAGDSSIQH
jgi:osmotically-inducible protein OsmY